MMRITEILRKNQNIICVLGSLNLGALSMGLAMGWPNPSFTYLNVKISTSQVLYVDKAWIESTLNLAASLGSLSSILISDLYGRRISFGLSAVILLGFWIFLVTSEHDRTLIISAAGVAGFGVGLFTATAILYVMEISMVTTQKLGGIVLLFGYLGVFGINLLGHCFEISIVLSAMVAFPVLYLVTLYFWMMESPVYLFRKGMVLEAKISLKNLRGRRNILEIEKEYKLMEENFNSDFTKNLSQILLESMCPKDIRVITLIITPLLCISQMLGIQALNDYAQELINTIYSNTGNLVTTFIDVFSILIFLTVIERFGSKTLLLLSVIGSGFCCFVLGIYNFTGKERCREEKITPKDHGLLPLTTISLYYAIYALGLIPVLPIVTGEIFSYRAKTIPVAICTSLLFFLQFFVQRFYEALNKYTSSCLAFVCFAMLGSIGLPFAMIFLPEAKEKSLSQVQIELGSHFPIYY